MFEAVNELAVLVSSMLGVALGSIWYSPLLFGRAWQESAGLTIEDEKMTLLEASMLTVKGILAQTVFFFIIAYALAEISRVDIPLLSFSVLLLVLLVSAMMGLVFWERRSFLYFLIHAGYGVLSLASGILVITFWPW